MVFVVDKSLDLLLKQINEAAPNRRKDSDGSIGDADHQSRDSAHNPQRTVDSEDGNDPDYQVDARDFTHDPENGADMAVVTEALRKSRDRRLHLVIFNGRIFSSYSRDGIAPFTWRPYTGSNQHTKHAHVEDNDLYNDTLTPWQIGIDVSTQTDEIVYNYSRGIPKLANGKTIEPVLWRQRDEAWQKTVDEKILALASDVNNLKIVDAAAVAELLKPALGELVEAAVRKVLLDGVA